MVLKKVRKRLKNVDDLLIELQTPFKVPVAWRVRGFLIFRYFLYRECFCAENILKLLFLLYLFVFYN